jgi:aspartyl-tRNA(Asn)/glutamyl-tRNA(Gln) amidotransferase subunit A
MTFAESRRALERGETSCEQLVSSYLDRIREDGERLNVFTSVDEEGAVNQARYLDSRRERGESDPLTGMIMAVKDVICIKGRIVTCASRMLEHFESLYDASVIARLREAGVIFIGKTNCDQFAMGSSNENSYFGPVRNPAHTDYVSGGSSGGSAAAVAAGMCHTALGTDTGGSIRQPAAFCGVVGLKPTYGRVSRHGLVAFASSFDCIGPFGQRVEDVALVLNHIAGKDRWDATSAPVEVPDYTEALTGSVEGVRIGLPREYFAEGLDASVRRMIQERVSALVSAGAEVKDVSLPHTEYGIATYYILTPAEASSNLARYDGIRYGYRADLKNVRDAMKNERRELEAALAAAESDDRIAELRDRLADQESLLHRLYTTTRTEGFGEEVKRRIMLGTYVLSSGYYDAYYAQGQKVRTLIRSDFDRVFEEVDVLATPVTPAPAFKLGSKVDDPLEMYLSDVYTVNANLAGIPGLAVPIGKHPDAPHLPVGMQLLGRHFDEAALLQVGDAIERLDRVPA